MPLATSSAVVIGGGIAGVAAARRLAAGGEPVTVFEARGLGGCIRSVPFADRLVDVGAEGLHTAAPGVTDLLDDLGLRDEVVEATRTVTWIATPRGLRPLPDGVGPAGPTRFAPLARSGLLSAGGLLRAALEPFVPRTRMDTDLAVGTALAHRFGPQVVDRVLEPLLGGLHAGDVARLSVAAATPQLAAVLTRHRSLVLAGRARAAAAGGLVSLRGGLRALVDALVADLPDVRTDAPVAAIRRGTNGRRYEVVTTAGERVATDRVVLAVPAAPAGALLGGLDPGLAEPLTPLRSATIAVVLLAYPTAAATTSALSGTGILVPASAGRLLKSATFLTTKWPHLAIDDRVLVRASVGRAGEARLAHLDDDALVAGVVRDLAELADLPVAPTDAAVVRWPRAMPQLEVGHRRRLAELRHRLAGHPGIAVAGAAYDGVGVTAALRSGTAAADLLCTAPAGTAAPAATQASTSRPPGTPQ